MKFFATLMLAGAASGLCATAQEPVTLTFDCSGDVAVSVDGAPGATARLTSVSHQLKSLGNKAIVCPDVNGNTSPTITMTFSVAGLPAGYTFDTVGLHIWAFNAGGATQSSTDGKARQYNVDIAANGAEFASMADLDPAAGVDGVNKLWDFAGDPTAAGDPLELTLTVTKGTENLGCFFGLEKIVLSTAGTTVEPEPEPEPEPGEGNVYTIKWKNNTGEYVAENDANALITTEYSTMQRIFWEFIPTENENCYYIRNTATGRYIGSCNLTPSSSSKIKTSATPVEYYMGESASTSGDNKGCVWLSSTDCANYDSESSGPRCLNRDGASMTVITWTAGVNNKGSYWTLNQTEDLYEVRPFTPGLPYYITRADGSVYTPAGNWEAMAPTSKAQRWRFEGTSNRDGGYRIFAVESGAALNDGAQYKISGNGPYTFLDGEGNALSLGGETEYDFLAARSDFALSHQIYQIPCGPIGNTWISKVAIGADFHYPMAVKGTSGISYPAASKPANKYVILSRDAARVAPGEEMEIAISIKGSLTNYRLGLSIDWDRDGYFEDNRELECAKETTANVAVPADATLGKVRARLRLTDNGLLGADEDISGEVLDLLLDVAEPTELIAPTVKVNDPTRGEATWADGIATATPKGNAMLLYWLDGVRIAGLEPTLEAPAKDAPRTLTAVFSVNTDTTLEGITLPTATDTEARIVRDGDILHVEAPAEVIAIALYDLEGRLTSARPGASLTVAGLPAGLYIAKGITASGIVSSKLKI